MISVQRREKIKQIITEKKTVSVSTLAEYFSVSLETIRRDLAALEAEGLIEKSYGGATLKRRVSSQAPQLEKINFMVNEKNRIAKAAAAFIQQNDCIFLDHSTTVLAMCEYMDDIPITVVTNSLPVFNKLAAKSYITLQSVSGIFQPKTQAFWGTDTLRYVQEHYFDKTFFSCRCLDIQRGIHDSSEDVANIHKYIIANSNTKFLLADHNKFGRTAFTRVCDLADVDYLITDSPLSEDWSAGLAAKNIHVIIGEDIIYDA